MLLPVRTYTVLAIGLASFHAALAVPTTASPGRLLAREALEDCKIDVAESWTYGRSNGGEFCASRIKQGHFVSGIKFWATDLQVSGMEVHYTDGESTMIGEDNGETVREWKWDPKDVSVQSAWGVPTDESQDKLLQLVGVQLSNEEYGRCTIHGLCSIFKPKDGGATGTLLGISGKTGSYGIEQITFHMLGSDVKGAKIHDVVFDPSTDELNKRARNSDRGLYNETIKVAHHANRLKDADSKFTFRANKEIKSTSSWSHTMADTWRLTAGLEIEHEANFIAARAKMKEKFEFFWEHKKETSDMKGFESSDRLEIRDQINVKPGKAVRITAWTVQGVWDVSWKAQNTITMQNGKEITVPVEGKHKSVTFADAWIVAEDEEVSAALAALEAGDGVGLNEKGEEISEEEFKTMVDGL